jgi:hypothetical protein
MELVEVEDQTTVLDLVGEMLGTLLSIYIEPLVSKLLHQLESTWSESERDKYSMGRGSRLIDEISFET